VQTLTTTTVGGIQFTTGSFTVFFFGYACLFMEVKHTVIQAPSVGDALRIVLPAA
jgi:hypothetical protein